jgi:hypothetical protein
LEIKGIGESPPVLATAATQPPEPLAVASEPLRAESSPAGVASGGPHPSGDLSLLAAAAVNSLPPPPLKRRRVAQSRGQHDQPADFRVPRYEEIRVDAVPQFQLSFPQAKLDKSGQHHQAMDLSTKEAADKVGDTGGGFAARASLLTIPNPNNFASLLRNGDRAATATNVSAASAPSATVSVAPLDMTFFGGKKLALDVSKARARVGSSGSSPPPAQSVSPNGGQPPPLVRPPVTPLSAPTPLLSTTIADKTEADGGSVATVATAPPVTGNGDPMTSLLGPSWKSRQPRMCQYCQRMFSNKFNLKQVRKYINKRKHQRMTTYYLYMYIFSTF